MTFPISTMRRSLSLSLSVSARRTLNWLFLTAVLGLMAGAPALTPAVHAQASAYHAVADSAYVPGHMYLNNADGTVTDVTDSYVQTGTVYDAQKGYTVQTGHVVDAAGSSIDVTVDINEGGVRGWGGKSIGFIAPQTAQPGS